MGSGNIHAIKVTCRVMDRYDDKQFYCKRLGHYVPFSYCRQVNGGIPCNQVMNCTFESIDIQGYMREHYADDEISSILRPPRDKVSSLIDLIEQAKKSKGK